MSGEKTSTSLTAPWTDLPSWRDEGIAWELGDMVWLPLRSACEACVLVAEERIDAAADRHGTAAGAVDVAELGETCREALAAARWLRTLPSIEDGAGRPGVAEPTVAPPCPAVGGGASLELPAPLRLPPASEARLLALLARVDATCLAGSSGSRSRCGDGTDVEMPPAT